MVTDLKALLQANTKLAKPIQTLQKKLLGVRAVIFGGAVRDVLTGHEPRDLDIVVSGATKKELRHLLHGYVYCMSSFGGFKVYNVAGIEVDIWVLEKSLVFTKMPPPIEGPTWVDLVRSSFFNVESVTLDLHDLTTVTEHGFFEALSQKRLEIQYEPNPFPAFQVLRSAVLVKKLGFTLGPKLQDYVKRESQKASVPGLMKIQASHYKREIVTAEELSRFVCSSES